MRVRLTMGPACQTAPVTCAVARSGHCPFFAGSLPRGATSDGRPHSSMGPRRRRGGTVADLGDDRVTLTEVHDERGCHLAVAGRLDVRTVADLRLALHRSIAG